MKVAFDWDGTLVHHGDNKPNYEDAAVLDASTQPVSAAVWAVQLMMNRGHEVHIITGRGKNVREITLCQIRRFLVENFPASNLHTQDRFTGYEDMRRFKAEVLNRIGATQYVGDHEMDRLAAWDARVAFQDAADFEKRNRLLYLAHAGAFA